MLAKCIVLPPLADVPEDTTVFTLTASDLDSPPSSLRYSITSGDEDGIYILHLILLYTETYALYACILPYDIV